MGNTRDSLVRRMPEKEMNMKPNLKESYAPYEKDLSTKMLQIQSKRFYLDVKENKRGKFIKVAEIAADGRRDQIFLALSTAAEFRDHLTTFSNYYSSLGPHSPETTPTDDGKLKSEIMIKDNRRYYLDLKENNRGRFLRVSQTISRGGFRSHLAIPAQGDLPESQHVRVEGKSFHFDVGQNSRGIYMKISEVQPTFRAAITIPERSWPRFRDIMNQFCDKMEALELEQKELRLSDDAAEEAEAAAAAEKEATKDQNDQQDQLVNEVNQMKVAAK